jgi:hypothetical protein
MKYPESEEVLNEPYRDGYRYQSRTPEELRADVEELIKDTRRIYDTPVAAKAALQANPNLRSLFEIAFPQEDWPVIFEMPASNKTDHEPEHKPWSKAA